MRCLKGVGLEAHLFLVLLQMNPQVELFGVGLPAQVALVVDAVLHREHVPGLVGRGLERPQEAEAEGLGGVRLPVPVDRPHPDPLPQRRLANASTMAWNR